MKPLSLTLIFCVGVWHDVAHQPPIQNRCVLDAHLIRVQALVEKHYLWFLARFEAVDASRPRRPGTQPAIP